jgi:hypothetical protein
MTDPFNPHLSPYTHSPCQAATSELQISSLRLVSPALGYIDYILPVSRHVPLPPVLRPTPDTLARVSICANSIGQDNTQLSVALILSARRKTVLAGNFVMRANSPKWRVMGRRSQHPVSHHACNWSSGRREELEGCREHDIRYERRMTRQAVSRLQELRGLEVLSGSVDVVETGRSRVRSIDWKTLGCLDMVHHSSFGCGRHIGFDSIYRADESAGILFQHKTVVGHKV